MTQAQTETQTAAQQDNAAGRFVHERYLLRKQFFKIFGGAFHIYDPEGNVALYSRMKAFKIREDIRLYTDDSMDTEVLKITTASIWDFSGAYDVVDSFTGEHVGALKRSGLKSMFRDQWGIINAQGQEVGQIQEDSTALALTRRFIELAATFLPQKYHAELDGRRVAEFKQHFNPFIQKIDIDFSMDVEHRLDPRLGLAAAVLLCAIEGRQDS